MQMVYIILTILCSVFSTATMSYISMAMPLGPWIAPTIGMLLLVLFRVAMVQHPIKPIALITAGSSVGGIVATGFGFSFPTLYFLQPTFFDGLMAQPYYFSAIMGCAALAAGAFGIGMAELCEKQLLEVERLAFPIGQIVYKLISLGNGMRKAYQLCAGMLGTFVFCMLQTGVKGYAQIIPQSLTLVTGRSMGVLTIPTITFSIWPMLWAIGFIAGHFITIPLLVGAVSKSLLVDPMHRTWFSHLSSTEVLFAFCSGMVLYGTVSSFIDLPKMLKRWYAQRIAHKEDLQVTRMLSPALIELLLGIATSVVFFSWMGFPLLLQLFVLGLTALFSYQIMGIAGKIGLAPLGRFATFVMLPALFLFSLSYMQIVLIATFVEICGGVAADVLFGRKLAQLAEVSKGEVKRYQYFGLLVCALCVGAIFLVLITKLGLGSAQLFAYKAQSRQLLIDARQFNWYVLLIGVMFGFVLRQFRVNGVLVLGGLLMPISLSLGLIFGGMLTYLVPSREKVEPFWSGVFVANSLWMFFGRFVQ